MTVALAWSSGGLASATVEIRWFLWQGSRLLIVHGASPAIAKVVGMARAAVLSVATSVAPIMVIHGSTTAIATAYPMATSTSISAKIHANQRRMLRHSTAIATAFHQQQVPWQLGAIATAIL